MPPSAVNPEQAKYEQMWQFEQYRRYAPGERIASQFLKLADPQAAATVIDYGAGTGRGAKALADYGLQVRMLDFADNCLDATVKSAVDSCQVTFNKHDLLNPIPFESDYGYCTDVMEHIQPEHVDQVIDNILSASKKVFFQISLEDDACGALIGEHLHLTVKPMEWWTNRMARHNAFIYYSEKVGENAIFYVSRIEDKSAVVLNIEEDHIVRNITANVSRGLKQLTPHSPNNKRLVLLAGGPSLNDYEDTIHDKAKNMPIICTNGTYDWCLQRGITPKGLIVVDARPNNAKFVTKVIPDCKYMFASQCHPDLFDTTPPDQTWIWHSHIAANIEDKLDELYGGDYWYSVPGGPTVMLRGIMLLGMLGWKKLDIYGFDSCLREDEHHAYEQSENDGLTVQTVTGYGHEFKCHPWMTVQAQEFERLYKAIRGNINLRIFGDGFISTVQAMVDKGVVK